MLGLYAAFNTKTGEVLAKTATRHTSAEFVAFLTNIVTNQPRAERVTSSPTTDLGEPQLHVVEPGEVRRTEVNMNVAVSRQKRVELLFF